jgi:hypothetical protein
MEPGEFGHDLPTSSKGTKWKIINKTASFLHFSLARIRAGIKFALLVLFFETRLWESRTVTKDQINKQETPYYIIKAVI